MILTDKHNTNLCPCTDGHWTKCVSSNLSWHKVQDSVFPVEWLLLADAEPSSDAPLWGKAGAAVAASADVLELSGSPPEREARGRGCRAGEEAGLGLVWLTPPAIAETVSGRPELLLPPATAEWTCVWGLGWFWDALSSRSSSWEMNGPMPMPIPNCLRLISAKTGAGKIMGLLMGAVLAAKPAGISPGGIPAILWVTRLGGMAAPSIGLLLPLGLWRLSS